MFLKNCWYAAAFSDEIGHALILARQVIDEQMLREVDVPYATGRPAAE